MPDTTFAYMKKLLSDARIGVEDVVNILTNAAKVLPFFTPEDDVDMEIKVLEDAVKEIDDHITNLSSLKEKLSGFIADVEKEIKTIEGDVAPLVTPASEPESEPSTEVSTEATATPVIIDAGSQTESPAHAASRQPISTPDPVDPSPAATEPEPVAEPIAEQEPIVDPTPAPDVSTENSAPEQSDVSVATPVTTDTTTSSVDSTKNSDEPIVPLGDGSTSPEDGSSATDDTSSPNA